jgi:poly(hydroxyalkanoate) granule-associated protein
MPLRDSYSSCTDSSSRFQRKDKHMVKKLQKMAQKKASNPGGLLDNPIAAAVKEQAEHIWLAGMGAFSKAQAEGGKAFEQLRKQGTTLQKKTQGLAEERISTVTSKMTAVAGGVGEKAGASWDKLESIFEARVEKALNKMGVPSRKDINALIRRIDELSAKVGPKTAARTPAKAAAKTVRAAAKKAPVKRAARKAA